MRLISVAAARGMAIAALLITPGVLMGAPSAHADSGVDGYAHCIGGGAKPPPPGVSPENWFPSVHIMETDIDSGVPPAELVQRLAAMGVDQKDAVTRVQCFVAYEPR